MSATAWVLVLLGAIGALVLAGRYVWLEVARAVHEAREDQWRL